MKFEQSGLYSFSLTAIDRQTTMKLEKDEFRKKLIKIHELRSEVFTSLRFIVQVNRLNFTIGKINKLFLEIKKSLKRSVATLQTTK